MELKFPTKGYHVGNPASAQPKDTSRDMNNVRPFYDGRACGGQRPGLDKLYSSRIGDNANYPVVAICSVTKVD